jgi:hypothetical protein
MMMFPRPNETDEQFSLRYDRAAYALELLAIEHDKEMRLSDPAYSRFYSPEDEADHLAALVGMKAALDARVAAAIERGELIDDDTAKANAAASGIDFENLDWLDGFDEDAQDTDADNESPADPKGDKPAV